MKFQMEKLREFFEGKQYIISAYLFGSIAGSSSEAKLEPDVDLAIFLSGDNPFERPIDAKFSFQEEISKHLNIKEKDVDVLILNNAPSVISHEVLKTGFLLYERDREERIDFEIKKEHKYYDTKYLRKIFFEEIKKWANG